MLKVYGHYASQPTRSVIWLLKMHKINFDLVKIDPLKGDNLKPEFKSKFPTGLIPVIDDNGFILAESAAIMQYICEKHNLSEWWPTNPKSIEIRAKISEYLFFHGSSTRKLTHLLSFPYYLEKFKNKPWDAGKKEIALSNARLILEKFGKSFLVRPDSFIGGLEKPSIADLIAYPDIAQLEQLGIVSLESICEGDKVVNWTKKMSLIPLHDDVHRTVMKIGQLE